MSEADFPACLLNWRRMNGMRQTELASLLGVSQGTVSRWESGRDLPTVARMRDISEFLANRRGKDPFALDIAFLRMQADCRALFDFDGARLLAVSRGLEAVWPDFANLVGTRMRPHLVGESAAIYCDRRLSGRLKSGEVGIVSGTSIRHVDLTDDRALRHHWNLAFRRYAGRTVGEMVYQPCEETRRLGIERVVSV